MIRQGAVNGALFPVGGKQPASQDVSLLNGYHVKHKPGASRRAMNHHCREPRARLTITAGELDFQVFVLLPRIGTGINENTAKTEIPDNAALHRQPVLV
jgi:hypothetical protein